VPDTSPNASGVGGFKTAMQLMGIIENRHMSRPNKVLSDDKVARIKGILATLGML
jgi:4-hydroxy-tetrahydrodipicolinate synthase